MTENYRTDDSIEDEAFDEESNDSSRRDFMKKSAVATGALALGSAATSGAVSAQSGDPSVLVFTYQYYPNVKFKVRQPLTATTTVQLLQRPSGNTVPEISTPDDYNGYVIDYRVQGNSQNSGIVTFLFTKSSLDQNGTYKLSGDAQVFTSALNLLQTNANKQ